MAIQISTTSATQAASRQRSPVAAKARRTHPAPTSPNDVRRAWRLCGIAQPVPDRAHGGDRGRVLRHAEPAPEIADVDIDDVGAGVVFISPHRAEDLLAREHASTVAKQVHEQLELSARQAYLLVPVPHAATEQIDLNAGTAQCPGRRLPCLP